MLYVLRHEQRDLTDPSFDSSLTDSGAMKCEIGNVTYEHLQKANIDVIYCSPFLRCLQTIKHYAAHNNIVVYVDYRLSEFIDHDVFAAYVEPVRKLCAQELEEYNASVVYTYDDLIDEFVWPESKQHLKHRAVDFWDSHAFPSDKNILVCSHESTIKELLNARLGFNFGYHNMGQLYFVDHNVYIAALNTIAYTMIYTLLPTVKSLTQVISLKEKVINMSKALRRVLWMPFISISRMESNGC